MVKQFTEPAEISLSPEILVPRLGDYMVERGTLAKEQLSAALKIQKADSAAGKYRLLGQILITEGFTTQSDLDTAITEQIVQLQDALKKSNTQLEERVQERTVDLQKALNKITELNRLKTNFVSNVSHELRTPLAHMVGYLELLRDGSLGKTNEEQNHALGVLVKSYNRLHGLIDELIEFSLVSEGDMSLVQEPVSVTTILQATESHAQKLANEKQIQLLIKHPAEEIFVLADKSKISWVIGELIINGIKFNNPGGKVLFEINQSNGVINFKISDNGIGFKADQLEEIFEPFHQLDGSSTRRYGGTGIGLALSKQIIEAHGSTLKARSVVDKGSSFEFSLISG
ncbi:MAG: HAMP domain-containing sensor histidine kinase [Chloroflexota bacterium]